MVPVDRAYRVVFFDGPPDPWSRIWPPPRIETVRARELFLRLDGQVGVFTGERDESGAAVTHILEGAWGFDPI